VQCYGLE